MVDSVTNRGRRGSRLLARLRSPRAHVLTKTPGQTVNVLWEVENQGGATGQATLQVRDITGTLLASLGPIGILAGSRIAMQTAWTIPAATGITYIVQALMIDVGENSVLDAHPFTVNVPAPAPAPAPPTMANFALTSPWDIS